MISKPKFRESCTQYEDVNKKHITARSGRSNASNSGREVKRFWSRLSKPEKSKSESLTALESRRKDHYLKTSFNDIIEQSSKNQEAEEQKAEKRAVRNLNSGILQSSRFAAGDFSSSSRLHLPVHTFINALPHAWGREIAVLKANVQQSLQARKNSIHTGKKELIEPSSARKHSLPVPAISIMPPHNTAEFEPSITEPDWVLQVRHRLRMAEEDALNQAISLERMRELHAHLSDFDLVNRPTHFIHLNSTKNERQGATEGGRVNEQHKSLFLSPSVHDPLEGEEDARSIYARLPTIISEESLNTVMDRGDVLLDYLGMRSSSASSFGSVDEENERDGESSEAEKVGFDIKKKEEKIENEDLAKSEGESGDELEALLEEVGGREENPQDVGITNDEISMSQSKESLFELECLRDLVSIAASDDLWEDIAENKKAS